MLAVKISDLKYFMNKFLCSETFDHFLTVNASITTYITYQIDGKLHLDFYSDEDSEKELLSDSSYTPFSKIRQSCYEIIKGKRTPLSFQFIFMLSKDNQSRTLNHMKSSLSPTEISGMYVNLNFQNKQLICTCSISYTIFTIDRSLEREWERLLLVFLKNNGIIYELL